MMRILILLSIFLLVLSVSFHGISSGATGSCNDMLKVNNDRYHIDFPPVEYLKIITSSSRDLELVCEGDGHENFAVVFSKTLRIPLYAVSEISEVTGHRT